MGRELTADDIAKLIAAQPIGDTLSRLGQPQRQYGTVSAVEPSLRDVLRDKLQKLTGETVANATFGRAPGSLRSKPGFEGMGIADFVPFLGAAVQGDEGLKHLDEGADAYHNGNYGSAAGHALGAGLGMLPGGIAIGKIAKPMAEALVPKARQMLGDAADSYMTKMGLQQNILAPKGSVGKHLEGMPELVDMGGGRLEPFSTDQRLVDIAGRYMSDKGLPFKEMTKYAPVDTKRAGALAQAFETMKHDPADPAVSKAYKALMDETQDQYEALLRAGYKFDFIKGVDPYGNPRNAINDLVQNKHMSVFPTLEGFGSSEADIAGNPLLKLSDLKIGDDPTTYNDLFRAVHDAFGHAQHGVGFRARGEENAFQSHARMYSPDAIPAATSETRGQNSWVNYGPFGERNRVLSPADTTYADQKTGIMPEWTWIDGVGE